MKEREEDHMRGGKGKVVLLSSNDTEYRKLSLFPLFFFFDAYFA